MKLVLVLIGFLLIGSGAVAMPCDIDARQFQAEALTVLQKDYPDLSFTPGASLDVIRMGEVEFGLQNIRSRICLADPPFTASVREQEIRRHFQAMMVLKDQREPKMPHDWTEAQRLINLQFMPEDYIRPASGGRVIITRPVIPGVLLGVVVKLNEGYGYAREEDRARWDVTESVLFDTALQNLDRMSTKAKMQGKDGPDKFLAIEEKDGFDAVRILVPWIRQEAVKFLGNPFYVALPNRDFLVMWSAENSAGFQQFAKYKAQEDFKAQAYPLSPAVIRVWADGRMDPDM